MSYNTLADSMNSDYNTGSLGSSTHEVMNDMKNYSSKDCNIEDFHIKAVIGRGSFGKVYVVTKRDDDKVYAMKTLKKDMILRKN